MSIVEKAEGVEVKEEGSKINVNYAGNPTGKHVIS